MAERGLLALGLEATSVYGGGCAVGWLILSKQGEEI